MRCVIIVYYVQRKISGYTRERLSKSIGGRKKNSWIFSISKGSWKSKTWQLIGTDTLALKSDILPSGPPFSRIPKSVQNWWGVFICAFAHMPISAHIPISAVYIFPLLMPFFYNVFFSHTFTAFTAFTAFFSLCCFFPLFKIVAIVQKHPAKLVDVMLTNDCPYF